jgi:hypothetical protein
MVMIDVTNPPTMDLTRGNSDLTSQERNMVTNSSSVVAQLASDFAFTSQQGLRVR